jgi:hypothetical protein
MDDGYKFRIEYEIVLDDKNPNDDSKIRLITYGDTAKEVLENHNILMDGYFTDLKRPSNNNT